MKITKIIPLLGLLLLGPVSGCVTTVGVVTPAPESIVYYGWCGDYYGPYYYGPSGRVVFGCPWGWHGVYRPLYPHFRGYRR